MTSGTVVHPRKVGWDVVPTMQVGAAEEQRHRQGKCLSQNHTKEFSQSCFRHWFLVPQANTLSRGELTELESLSLNSQDCLFHAAEDNDGWHMAYALSVLSMTLRSLLKKIGMWLTLTKTFAQNKCWHWVVVCGTGKKTNLVWPWVLGTWNSWSTTAITSLPETECLMRKWELERDCKYWNSSGRFREMQQWLERDGM